MLVGGDSSLCWLFVPRISRPRSDTSRTQQAFQLQHMYPACDGGIGLCSHVPVQRKVNPFHQATSSKKRLRNRGFQTLGKSVRCVNCGCAAVHFKISKGCRKRVLDIFRYFFASQILPTAECEDPFILVPWLPLAFLCDVQLNNSTTLDETACLDLQGHLAG